MRLGQLARKLELRPIEIVEFLATKNIIIDDGTNTKLEAAHAMLAIQKFAPGTEIEDYPDSDSPAIASPSADLLLENMPQDPAQPLNNTDPEIPTEQIEIIKAPKVELSGLKVLGKIELPEVKKKPAEPTQENHTEGEAPKRKREPKKLPQATKNPIALQREQEALAARKKKEEEVRLQKERRTQNYLKKVKAHQPTKAVRLVKEHTEQISDIDLTEPPKTWWGKLIKWLTT